MNFEGLLQQRLEIPSSRRSISRFRGFEAPPRVLSSGRSFRGKWLARGYGVVLQRLSRHGPAPGGIGGHARGDRRRGSRLRRHAQYLWHNPLSRGARKRACRPAWQGSRASFHLSIRCQRRDALDPRQARSRHGRLLGREKPRLDDRGHPPREVREAHFSSQRRCRPRGETQEISEGHAQDHRLRERLLHGRAHRADRGDLRSRREVRGAHLPRRGARGRHVRPARRGHCRARRRHGPGRHHQRHARQGVRRHGRLHRRLPRPLRCDPLVCLGVHLHDIARACDRGRRACFHPPFEDERARARPPPGAGSDTQDGRSRRSVCPSWTIQAISSR